MAKQNFEISFSIDLTPYKEGLKSALMMTQATGQQIKPLLNFKIAAPDFSGIEAEFSRYEEQLKRVATETQNLPAPTPFDEAPPKIDNTNKKLDEHGLKLNKVKRESLEMFGAVSFLTTSIIGMASSAEGGNEKLDKLNNSLSGGITAGFGLASMMTMLGIASGGTAAIIGSLVTIGVGLTSWLTDTKKKADDVRFSFEGMKQSIKGATLDELQILREQQEADYQNKMRLANSSIENARKILELEHPGILYSDDAVRLEIKRAKEAAEGVRQAIQITDEAMNSQRLSGLEVVKLTSEAEIASIQDKYDRQVEEAKAAWEKQKILIENSTASEQQKRDAIEAGETALNQKIIEIYDAQGAEFVQHKQEEERQAEESRKRIETIQTETAKALNEAEKQRELAKATSAQERVAIEERYAIQEIDLQETVAKSYAESEEEKTALTDKYNAIRQQIRAQSSVNFIEAEKRDVEAAKQSQEAQRREWIETHEVALGVLRGVTDGFIQATREMLLSDREAKRISVAQMENNFELYKIDIEKRKDELQKQLNQGEIDRREYELRIREISLESQQREKELDDAKRGWVAETLGFIENATIQALTNIAAKEIENAAISIGLEGTKQAANIATMQTSAAAGTTKAAESAAAIPFPANLIAIGAAIAASMILFAGIREAFGFEQGGRLRKGDVGFIEGYHDEIIAPERTFRDIMYREFIPRQVVESGGGGLASTKNLEKKITQLTRSLDKMPSRVIVEQKGDDFYGVWENSSLELQKRFM